MALIGLENSTVEKNIAPGSREYEPHRLDTSGREAGSNKK
jgi:hypothetical protein